MNKQEFLLKLRAGIVGLPQEDIEERAAFYNEMIDDRLEEGFSEEEAVAEIGSVDEIVQQIIAETPLTKIVRENAKPKRKLKTWETVLLAVGSPIWASLLIAAAAVVLSFYITLWALVISLWAVEFTFAVSAVGCVMLTVVLTVNGNAMAGLATLGAGFVLAGLAIFLFFGCKAASKGVVLLAKKIVLWVKSIFMKKEAVS